MTEQTRILFFIPVWGRLKITEACYRGLKRLMQSAPGLYSFQTLIVYSEPEHAKLSQRYGFHIYHHKNRPIGAKFNAGMQYALESFEFDYVFQLNSDNVFSNRVWDLYGPYIEKRIDFFGIDKIYCYHPQSGRMMFYIYYDGCGAGRVIRRDIVEQSGWCLKVQHKSSRAGTYTNYQKGAVEYIPGKRFKESLHTMIDSTPRFLLWEPERNKGLDNNSARRIFEACNNYPMKIPRHDKPIVVDIKSDTNIWKYDDLKGDELNAQEKGFVFREFEEINGLMIKEGTT